MLLTVMMFTKSIGKGVEGVVVKTKGANHEDKKEKRNAGHYTTVDQSAQEIKKRQDISGGEFERTQKNTTQNRQ
jgi:hypothetical protein